VHVVTELFIFDDCITDRVLNCTRGLYSNH
jgi:hypothetical protein